MRAAIRLQALQRRSVPKRLRQVPILRSISIRSFHDECNFPEPLRKLEVVMALGRRGKGGESARCPVEFPLMKRNTMKSLMNVS